MSTNYDDDDTTMPLYQKPEDASTSASKNSTRSNHKRSHSWRSQSPLRRVLHFWRIKQQRPFLRWLVLIFFLTVLLITAFEMRTHAVWTFVQRVKVQVQESQKVVGEWDLCPGLISELDNSRKSDYNRTYDYDDHNSHAYDTDELDQSKWAKILPAPELLAMAQRGERLPQNIIHQSWKTTDNLPDDFDKWSKDWRRIHGSNWVYVLWVDEDNRNLIKTFYPEYLETYDSLPRVIYQVDMVRNAYMHRFGGLYADLDLVPLTPLQDHLPILQRDRSYDPLAVAYLGHMGAKADREQREQRLKDKAKGKASNPIGQHGGDEDEDEDDWDIFEHSIPNAFMISSRPGHPFWLQAMDYVKDHIHDGDKKDNRNRNRNDNGKDSTGSHDSNTPKESKPKPPPPNEPEKLTGPVALKECVKTWNKAKNRKSREAQGMFDELIVLPDGKIYPFSWYDGSTIGKCLCRRHSPFSDEKKCNSLYPDAWTITYWTHSWGW